MNLKNNILKWIEIIKKNKKEKLLYSDIFSERFCYCVCPISDLHS